MTKHPPFLRLPNKVHLLLPVAFQHRAMTHPMELEKNAHFQSLPYIQRPPKRFASITVKLEIRLGKNKILEQKKGYHLNA